jgi:hypothetical protein
MKTLLLGVVVLAHLLYHLWTEFLHPSALWVITRELHRQLSSAWRMDRDVEVPLVGRISGFFFA